MSEFRTPVLNLPNLPGILAGFAFAPDTAKPMRELAEAILRAPSTLTQGVREALAAYVSSLNNCRFCTLSHAAAAKAALAAEGMDDASAAIDSMLAYDDTQKFSRKVQALFVVAEATTNFSSTAVRHWTSRALNEGATEREVHDVVLLAAAFNMYNRYVEGLQTTSLPAGDPAYTTMGVQLTTKGYLTE